MRLAIVSAAVLALAAACGGTVPPGGGAGGPILPAEEARPAPAAARPDVLTNRQVREAQEGLRMLGLYDGPIDGLYGRRSIAAVKDFQEAHDGLRLTGMLDAPTRRAIREAAAQHAAARAKAIPDGPR